MTEREEEAASAPILVVDDDQSVLDGLQGVLEAEGYDVDVALDGESALERLNETAYGVVLADLKLPGMDGLELHDRIREDEHRCEVIIITGAATVDSVVKALREGVNNYLLKPLETEQLTAFVASALEKYRLHTLNARLRREIASRNTYGELIGRSPEMREIFELIEAVSATETSVLISGASGTGKELVARALHDRSDRSEHPFIAVNCAAFPRDILENELFGHEKGAFTGSLDEKAGCFELADGGTLFLDEVAEMEPDTQVKLLRALETRRFRRLGGKEEIEVDIRVVAATNRDLDRALREGDLREDLYYRLAVVEIELPPLRDRGSDVQLLAGAFLEEFAEQHDRDLSAFSPEAERFLSRYEWPGNVRELRNAVERAVIVTHEDPVPLEALRPRSANGAAREVRIPIGESLSEVEGRVILQTLAANGGDRSIAAETLGLDPEVLDRRLQDLIGPVGSDPA